MLRHATTHKEAPPGGNDRHRLLSEVGEADAKELHGVLVGDELGVGLPERVLYSQAARTAATATIVFGDLVGELWGDARLYGADPEDVVQIIAELPDELTSVAIVGHNPTIHGLSLELPTSAAGTPFAARLRPGELCVLSAETDSWNDAGFGEYWLSASWRLNRP